MADYVNNKELYAELVIYRAEYLKSVEDGAERPQVSTKIAAAIIQICTRMSYSKNFSGYTYREDMVADAILKCFAKIHLFDPERTENPFSMLSQICWNEFLNRIKVENHQTSVKARLIRNKLSDEFVQHGVDSVDDETGNSFVEFLKDVDAYTDYHELAIENAKKEAAAPSLIKKHRNLTPYKKKAEVVPVEVVPEIDLFTL